MPDVNADRKAKTKAAAANIAVTLNDTAVVLGAGGVWRRAPAGFLVGRILGIGSFGARPIANRLANDPPSNLVEDAASPESDRYGGKFR